MSAPQDPRTDGAPDETRSGADIAEAIEVAERGSAVEEVHEGWEHAGPAAVEGVAGDPDMTEGEVVHGEGGHGSGEHGGDEHGGGEPGEAPNPAAAGSGGAQSVVGPRTSDRLAAGEPKPAGPPFDTD
jgi:hypothetical protein